MLLNGYNVRKAAQVAAFFALKESSKEINTLKLTKLIYLSDRESLDLYDTPILYDRFVSMPHGPVNSISYDFIAGGQQDEAWDEFIEDKAGYAIGLCDASLSEESLDELSDAEIAILENVWNKFGHMDRFALRDWTHEHCPEWEDPHGSSTPIPYERILKNLGKKDSSVLSDMINEERRLFQFAC